MQDLPHQYTISASAEPEGSIALKTDDAPLLITAAATQFGGPGDQWSPEALLVGSVVDGFSLTFRTIARTSKLEWSNLECYAEGTLNRVDGVSRFTAIVIRATLSVSAGTDTDKARMLLEKAEAACMVARSLLCAVQLDAEIVIES